MATTMYTLSACEKLIDNYIERGGEIYNVEEGTLGLGVVICMADNCKTAIIQERYLNSWSSGHTIRLYKRIPKKYMNMIEKYLENGDE